MLWNLFKVDIEQMRRKILIHLEEGNTFPWSLNSMVGREIWMLKMARQWGGKVSRCSRGLSRKSRHSFTWKLSHTRKSNKTLPLRRAERRFSEKSRWVDLKWNFMGWKQGPGVGHQFEWSERWNFVVNERQKTNKIRRLITVLCLTAEI